MKIKSESAVLCIKSGPPGRTLGIMSYGTEGDTNNIDFRGPAVAYPPYARIKIVANDVAQEVFKVSGNRIQNWVSVGAAQMELTLDVRKPGRLSFLIGNVSSQTSKGIIPVLSK